MINCNSCQHEEVEVNKFPCALCKTWSNWQIKHSTELLLKQLEIVIDHCNETGLKSGAGAVEEAIKLIKEGSE